MDKEKEKEKARKRKPQFNMVAPLKCHVVLELHIMSTCMGHFQKQCGACSLGIPLVLSCTEIIVSSRSQCVFYVLPISEHTRTPKKPHLSQFCSASKCTEQQQARKKYRGRECMPVCVAREKIYSSRKQTESKNTLASGKHGKTPPTLNQTKGKKTTVKRKWFRTQNIRFQKRTPSRLGNRNNCCTETTVPHERQNNAFYVISVELNVNS